jgi:hypothetical protein
MIDCRLAQIAEGHIPPTVLTCGEQLSDFVKEIIGRPAMMVGN